MHWNALANFQKQDILNKTVPKKLSGYKANNIDDQKFCTCNHKESGNLEPKIKTVP